MKRTCKHDHNKVRLSEAAAIRKVNKYDEIERYYHCPYCGDFHITKKKDFFDSKVKRKVPTMEQIKNKYKQLTQKKKKMNINILDASILMWAKDKGILKPDNSFQQMCKVTEEVGEVASAIARDDKELLKDAIGDAYVTLTILSGQNGLRMQDCIEHAWNEIKDRKGKTVNGVFVKEEK